MDNMTHLAEAICDFSYSDVPTFACMFALLFGSTVSPVDMLCISNLGLRT